MTTTKINIERSIFEATGFEMGDFISDNLIEQLTDLASLGFDHEAETEKLNEAMVAGSVAKTKVRKPKTATPTATSSSLYSPSVSTPSVESSSEWSEIKLTDDEPTKTDNEVIPMSERKHPRPSGEDYFARKWGNFTDVEVLRKAREASQYVLLYGEPGTGKTALVEASFPDELYTILGSGDTEVSDLVGSYVQTPSGNFEWVDGALVKSAEEGKVLLIDEIGLIDPKVLSVVYSLIDGRRELTITSNPERGTIKAKEGFYVVSATNPNAVGVRLSEALLSRFTIQAEMTTDWELAGSELGVNGDLIIISQNLSRKLANGETSWCPQMRELLAFRNNEKLFGTQWAFENLIACSPEMDRPVVANVVTMITGMKVLPAKI
jgi:nucleoside-triphosphatase THEP1